MAVPGEKVVFERFDFETYLDPAVNGVSVYDPNIISPHLRTKDYDLQLTTGAALLPEEPVYNPHEDEEGYGKRWNCFLRIRQRIETEPDFSARVLLGEEALCRPLGSSLDVLSPEELAERQVAAVNSVAADVMQGYQVGIVPFTADIRPVSAGRFAVVHFRSGNDMMVSGMRRGDFIEGRTFDSAYTAERVERADIAFSELWESPATVTEPEKVVDYLGAIATGLRTRARSI